MARASAFQADGCGFESHRPLQFSGDVSGCPSSGVEHFLGKEEVVGSNPMGSSSFAPRRPLFSAAGVDAGLSDRGLVDWAG